MIDKQLIHSNYEKLESGMTVSEALKCFDISGHTELPLVTDGAYLGLVFRRQIASIEDQNTLMSSLDLKALEVSIYPDERLVTALKLMMNSGIGLLPVIDHSQEMLGTLHVADLWIEFAKRSSFMGDGSWIVLSMNRKDYSLSELAHLVESHRLIIVFHFVQYHEGMSTVDVHLKVNRENVNELLQTFQRYGYKVTGVIQPQKFTDDWEGRFEELMRFFST